MVKQLKPVVVDVEWVPVSLPGLVMANEVPVVSFYCKISNISRIRICICNVRYLNQNDLLLKRRQTWVKLIQPLE